MSNGSALWKGDRWDTGWGVITLDEDAELTVNTSAGQDSLRVQLSDSAFVDAYASDSWACLLAAAGPQVVLARTDGPTLEVIAEVQRLDAGQGPAIGTHAVRFHPRPGTDQCLLAWEIGIALIDPDRGIVWEHLHGDPDQRVVSTSESAVDLKGLAAEMTIDLSSGEVTTRARNVPLVVDRATVAAWRQSIGR